MMKAHTIWLLCVVLFAVSLLATSTILAGDFEPDMGERSFWLKLLGYVVSQIIAFFAGKKAGDKK